MNQQSKERNRAIIRYSLIGVGMNLALAVMKIIVGILANAHAIIVDAVNSFSDMTASLISILSSYFAGRRGNRNHPFGYGRLEYLSSLLVTMIVLYIGIMAIIDSVTSILHPHEPPAYSAATVAVMVVSLLAKLLYGFLMKSRGKRLRSAALFMSAVDSMGDALISAGILAAIVLYRFTGFDIEHYVCIAISLMILRTGIGMIRDCATKMLGTRPDPEIRKKIVDLVVREEQVLNISSIMLHNYGEGNYVGSVDIEVEERLTAAEFSVLSRRIIRNAEEIGVRLTSVGISGTNVSDPEAVKTWDTIIDLARAYATIKRVSSLVVDPEGRELSFYVIPDAGANRQTRAEELRLFRQRVADAFPGRRIDIREGIDI